MDPAPQETLAHWKQVARASGLKLTHQRLVIFEALVANRTHPDADSIYAAVVRKVPTVSRDTVYRTLWKLHELGLIVTFGPRQGGIRFDTNLKRHHHFVCLRCGLVQDFESPALDTLQLPDSLAALGSDLEAHVEVRGTCAACQDTSPTPALT